MTVCCETNPKIKIKILEMEIVLISELSIYS